MNDRERLFREKLPQFTDYQAVELIGQHGEIVSVAGREAALDVFLLTFVSEKDSIVGPLSLNPVVARELCRLLLAHGYGPSQAHQT
jgi:hypothetical protein